jgi:hypothetical protein
MQYQRLPDAAQVTVQGTFGQWGDTDWFAVQASAGERFRLELSYPGAGCTASIKPIAS